MHDSENKRKCHVEFPNKTGARFPGNSSAKKMGALINLDRSPVGFLFLITFAIFVCETAIMFIIPLLPPHPARFEAFINFLLLTPMLSLPLYFFVFRPMQHCLHENKHNEDFLIKEHDELERQITKRAEELLRTNPVLEHEIAVREQAEQELLEKQEELLRQHNKLSKIFGLVEIAKQEWEGTLDCIQDMVILVDKEGKIKRCNKALTEFTKKSYEELLGKEWNKLLVEHGIDSDTLHERSIEHFHTPTGKWFTLKSYPFNMANHEPATVVTIHDTTEIKQITEQLEQKNSEIDLNRGKLQRALDEISSVIQKVAHKKEFAIRFNNPDLKKCHEMLGCTEKDCPCYGKEAMGYWQVAGTSCGGTEEKNVPKKHLKCTKCPVFKEVTSDPIYQIGEHFNNMMHILETKNSELENAYEELKATQATILQQEKLASIGQLAAGVAHEINNPVGFITSNLGSLRKYVSRLAEFIYTQSEVITSTASAEAVEKIQEKRKTLKLDYILEDTKELIQESLEGADRVKKIVQNLKSFSRLDESEYKHADINECIESTINIVWNELKYKTVLKKEYGDLPLTKCYHQQLNQVFMNLLVNAAQAIEKQGEIKIKTWQENGSIVASVSDTGCGIPEDKLDKVFEPFFTTKEAGKGTGLGLSIAYDIVKKHHGDITVRSKVGEGTTYTLRMPIVEGR
jgi:PAS domain S-box-containing protein